MPPRKMYCLFVDGVKKRHITSLLAIGGRQIPNPPRQEAWLCHVAVVFMLSLANSEFLWAPT